MLWREAKQTNDENENQKHFTVSITSTRRKKNYPITVNCPVLCFCFVTKSCNQMMILTIFFLIFSLQLGGIAMVVLGVSILYKYDVVLDVIKDSHAEVVPIVFIAIGSAIFLIAFFGCCGAIFESECMILTVSTAVYNYLASIPTI